MTTTNFVNNAVNGKNNNTYGNGRPQENRVDNLLRQVMQNADLMQQNKNFSPVKRDILVQRQQ